MNMQSPPKRIRALQRKIWLEWSVYRPLTVLTMIVATFCGFASGMALVLMCTRDTTLAPGIIQAVAVITAACGAWFVASNGVWDKWRAASKDRQEWYAQELSVHSGTMSEAEFTQWRASRRTA